MARQATRLRKLRVTRVDMVTDGANQGARILIAKALRPCATCEGVDKALSNLKPAPGKKCPTCGRVMPETTSKGGHTMPDTDTGQADLTALADAIEKAKADATAPLQDQLDQVTKELADLKAAAEATKDPEDIDKSALPEAVRKRLEDAETQAAQAAERVAKLEDAAETARWADVAKGLDHVAVAKATGGDATAELAGLLKRVAKDSGGDVVGDLVRLLTAAHARLSESALFAEAGADGTEGVSDADAQLEKLAKGLIATDPSLSFAQAMTNVATANPDLAIKAQMEAWNA